MRKNKAWDTETRTNYDCIEESNSYITVIIIKHSKIDDKEALRQTLELLGVK